MYQTIEFREASDQDMSALLAVHRDAFGRDEEADLVTALVNDPSARPLLSLIACDGDTVLGHILFTRALLSTSTRAVSASILAPLAVAPHAQGQGIGGRLINEGLTRLSRSGVELVFVLGHPYYYANHGFKPAAPLGLTAPYPIPEKNADAWMVRALKKNVVASLSAQVVCANALDKPEYWRE